MTQLARRQLLKLLGTAGAAGIAAPALAACGNASSAAGSDTSPIRVGLLLPKAGAFQAVGEEQANGFNLYLSLNGNALYGHPVQLVTADEGGNANSAKAALDKLLKEDNVQVVTGVANPAVMSGIRDQIEAAQVPLLGTNGSPFQLGDPKYIWRTSYVDNEPGQALGMYLAAAANRDSHGVFVVSDDSPSARDEVQGFVTAYQGVQGHPELAGDPMTVPLFTNPDANLGAVFSAIRGSGVRMVFGLFSGQGGSNFVKAFKANFGTSVALYAPGFLTEGDLLKQEGGAASGVYTAANYSPDLDNDANRTFTLAYQKAYNRLPTMYAMASYDAGIALEKALQLAGTDLSPQSINAALGRVGEIESPRGIWQFNQKRTPLQKWYLRQVRLDGAVLSNVLLSELATLT